MSSYNFAAAASGNTVPVGCLVMEDDDEMSLGLSWCPAAQSISADQIYTNRWLGNRFELPNGLWTGGLQIHRMAANATPGSLYSEIRDADNVLVPGCQNVLPFAGFTSSVPNSLLFPEPVYLPAGTYYAGCWQNGGGSSTNRYQMDRGPIVRDALHLAHMCRVFSTDITGGAPTASTDRVHPIAILTYDITPPIIQSGGLVNFTG